MDRTSDIKKEVEDVLPPGTSGIIAMFDITWKPKVDETLAKATKIDKEEVSPESAAKLKEEAVQGLILRLPGTTRGRGDDASDEASTPAAAAVDELVELREQLAKDGPSPGRRARGGRLKRMQRSDARSPRSGRFAFPAGHLTF